MVAHFYTLLPSQFGVLSIVWLEGEEGPRIRRVLLPRQGVDGERLAQEAFEGARAAVSPVIAALGERMTRFLSGEAVRFELDLVTLESCSDFQRRVLSAEYQIPRGWVSTYGRIAQKLGVPGAARAVGGALARNPFPIIIPCHRAVGSDGSLGGFQGGGRMKRALLEMEGVALLPSGKVRMDRLYY